MADSKRILSAIKRDALSKSSALGMLVCWGRNGGLDFTTGTWNWANDPKLSDRRSGRGTCRWEERRWRSAAGAVTAEPVRRHDGCEHREEDPDMDSILPFS